MQWEHNGNLLKQSYAANKADPKLCSLSSEVKVFNQSLV